MVFLIITLTTLFCTCCTNWEHGRQTTLDRVSLTLLLLLLNKVPILDVIEDVAEDVIEDVADDVDEDVDGNTGTGDDGSEWPNVRVATEIFKILEE